MENEKDIAISIKGLKKRYRLGVIGGGTLQGDIQSWWARVRGKDDPNLKIGKTAGNKNETFMALDGIDLTVYKGERLGIIGHNGAGKSTLLKLLSRVTAPTEGEICIDGRISSMLEVGTGFNGELTGRENIYLNGAILGMTTAEVDSKIEQIIEFSECRQFIDTPVKRYSSGMYVKLAFAVAAHLDSEILIMDEVLAVGDIAFQQKCLNKMQAVAEEEGKTILYVSHNMNTIQQLCDRCIVMDHGKIVFSGNVEKAIGIYAEMAQYMVCFKDYTNWKRKYKMYAYDLYLLSAEFVGKKTYSFFKNEKMHLRLVWENKENVKPIGFRHELKTATGSSICSYFVEKIYDGGQKGKKVTADIVFDLSKLVPGNYRTSYTFFYKNDYGDCGNVDCVRGLTFEIIDKDDNDNKKWDAQNWGYVEMEQPLSIEVSEVE